MKVNKQTHCGKDGEGVFSHVWSEGTTTCSRCGKSRVTTTKPNNEWEKEFDKKFRPRFTLGFLDQYNKPEFDSQVWTKGTVADIKNFISKTLQQQRKDLIKEIEGIVGEDEFIDRTSDITKLSDGDYMDNPELDRRNQLRKEIRDRLKQI